MVSVFVQPMPIDQTQHDSSPDITSISKATVIRELVIVVMVLAVLLGLAALLWQMGL